DRAHAYARTLSGGMRRRLLVAKAIVHAPPVLVLDEPTAGVDVDLRRQLWAYIQGLNERGTTVLLTTHYLEEAERLCDTIAIIGEGRLIACESTQSLLRRLDSKEMRITVDRDMESLPGPLAPFHVEIKDKRELVFCYHPSKTKSGEIVSAVMACGLSLLDITTREAELEDIFLRLTKGAEKASP
ncbi:MAG TPA: ABC transporter ATP-binding protein, partial [Rhodospirillales bacterium]|nr:ABC transporter ATP-binding protein [Rhodospirillales bacterium]